MVVEPWLYGQSAGVSPVALLVAVIFWTWLWGSVGLLLATPLTVCLIVLSKHLPSMGFLVLLMGDDPVLDRRRATTSDSSPGIRTRRPTSSRSTSRPMIPSPCTTRSCFPRCTTPSRTLSERISEADAEFVAHATREIVEDWTRTVRARRPRRRTATEGSLVPRRLLFLCPARDEIDTVAIAIAGRLIDATRWQVEILGTVHVDVGGGAS